MAKTVIYYYLTARGDNPVREFIVSLQKRQQAKVRRVLESVTEYGLLSIIPHVKKLVGLPLWEIRILGTDNIRIIYMVKIKDAIYVLHGFVKKTQKTPEHEIALALKRYKEILAS